MRLKLDELLRGVQGARTGFVSVDKMTDDELDEIEGEFERLKERYAQPAIPGEGRATTRALAFDRGCLNAGKRLPVGRALETPRIRKPRRVIF